MDRSIAFLNITLQVNSGGSGELPKHGHSAVVVGHCVGHMLPFPR